MVSAHMSYVWILMSQLNIVRLSCKGDNCTQPEPVYSCVTGPTRVYSCHKLKEILELVCQVLGFHSSVAKVNSTEERGIQFLRLRTCCLLCQLSSCIQWISEVPWGIIFFIDAIDYMHRIGYVQLQFIVIPANQTECNNPRYSCNRDWKHN